MRKSCLNICRFHSEFFTQIGFCFLQCWEIGLSCQAFTRREQVTRSLTGPEDNTNEQFNICNIVNNNSNISVNQSFRKQSYTSHLLQSIIESKSAFEKAGERNVNFSEKGIFRHQTTTKNTLFLVELTPSPSEVGPYL